MDVLLGAATRGGMEFRLNIRARLLLATIFGLALVSAGGASRNKPVQLMSGHSNFDASQKKLPPKFSGSDFMTVFRSSAIAPRGEFETTAEFERRSSAAPRRIVVFVLPTPEMQYDPDRSELTIKVPFESAYVGFNQSDSSHRSFLVRKFVSSRRPYIATNAFGASVAATAIERVRYSVISEDEREPWAMAVAIDVPPAKARSLKPKVRALLVCEIGPESRIEAVDKKLTAEQFAGATGLYFQSATFDDPEQVSEYHFSIRARIIDVWFFRADTGDVLLKASSSPDFKPDESTAEVAPGTVSGSQAPSGSPPPVTDRNAKRTSLVAVGMSKSEVQSILGKPDEQSEGWFGSLHGERWIYRRDGIVLEFALSDGRLRTVTALPQ